MLADIHPGHDSYVISPSGADKDRVLARLMQHARRGPGCIWRAAAFPGQIMRLQRGHEAVTKEAFATLVPENALAMHWIANNFWCGVATELAPLRGGHTVPVISSRGWLAEACKRFPGLIVAQTTAPSEAIAARLQQYVRETPDGVAARMERARALEPAPHELDISVVNGTTLDAAGVRLLRLLKRLD